MILIFVFMFGIVNYFGSFENRKMCIHCFYLPSLSLSLSLHFSLSLSLPFSLSFTLSLSLFILLCFTFPQFVHSLRMILGGTHYWIGDEGMSQYPSNSCKYEEREKERERENVDWERERISILTDE